MTNAAFENSASLLKTLSPDQPVLIAGPTASGKSALALEIADAQGGVIINADASQVYDCWRVMTARPSTQEEAVAPHKLYGHKSAQDAYSAGHWLREVTPLLQDGARPVVVGGTGLYFSALTRGLADIPETPADVRTEGNARAIEDMINDLDAVTRARTDLANRARVQRAWEVQRNTGRGLASWQAGTGTPVLSQARARCIVFDVDKEWLNTRIARRFDLMLKAGALDEARNVQPDYDPALPAHRAIGAPELIAHLRGEITLSDAREKAVISTRQFAKRQRTWFRSKMREWDQIAPYPC